MARVSRFFHFSLLVGPLVGPLAMAFGLGSALVPKIAHAGLAETGIHELVKTVDDINRTTKGKRECGLVLASASKKASVSTNPKSTQKSSASTAKAPESKPETKPGPNQTTPQLATLAAPPAPSAPPPDYPTENFAGAYKQTLNLSVLTPEQAQAAFCGLVKDVDQKNRNAVVCAHRSMINAIALEEMGIKSAKSFATIPLWRHYTPGANDKINPNLPGLESESFNWTYHVANVVLVKTSSGTRPYTIDPVLFPDGPAPLEEWEKLLSTRKDSVSVNVSIANRFAYRPEDTYNDLTNYQTSHVAQAKAEMRVAHSANKFNGFKLLPPRPQVSAKCK